MKIKTTLKIPKVKQRVTWGFNPVSRVKPSKKIYCRKKQKKDIFNINNNSIDN